MGGDAIDLLTRGQGDLKLARGGDGVIEEELVEVSDAKEQQRVGCSFLIAACCRISGVEVSLMGKIGGLKRASIAEPGWLERFERGAWKRGGGRNGPWLPAEQTLSPYRTTFSAMHS